MNDHVARERIRTYLMIWAATVLVPLLSGKLVHLAFAALVAAVFTITWWWLTEVAELAEPAGWTVQSRSPSRDRGADFRVSRLHREIGDVLGGNRAVGSDVALAQTLAQIIDERVLAHHGVSGMTDPGRYAAVIGPDLDAFVRSVAAGGAVRARQIPALIARIESL